MMSPLLSGAFLFFSDIFFSKHRLMFYFWFLVFNKQKSNLLKQIQMLRHIVMVSFKNRQRVDKLSVEFKTLLMDLVDKIPELNNMEVGLNVNTKPSAFDLALIADFEDINGLNIYRIHPEHVKVLNYMKGVVEKTAVVDYYL